MTCRSYCRDNLVNRIRSPTGVTKDTISLIDIIITSNDSIGELATVMGFGYSDHNPQILQLHVKTIVRICNEIRSRQCSEEV